LATPAELLNEWTASYNFRKNVATDYYSLESPDEIEKTLGSVLNDRGIQHMPSRVFQERPGYPQPAATSES